MATADPKVRIPVDPQALEKIPDVFRGTVYKTVTYTVDHYYGATERDLRVIETRSPESVMESSLGMALTVSWLYILYPSVTMHRTFFSFFFLRQLPLCFAGCLGSSPEHIQVQGSPRGHEG